jgi:hypothetical protein
VARERRGISLIRARNAASARARGFAALGASFFLSPQHRLRNRVNSTLLIVIDGAKGLHKAGIEVFGARGLISAVVSTRSAMLPTRYPRGCVPQSAAR